MIRIRPSEAPTQPPKRRREFPLSVKRAAYERSRGRCEACNAGGLAFNAMQYDHVLADGLGGEPTLENCEALCGPCHQAKTSTRDVPMIAKAIRIGKKWRGEKVSRNPMPGSRRSPWKKGFEGKAVRRD